MNAIGTELSMSLAKLSNWRLRVNFQRAKRPGEERAPTKKLEGDSHRIKLRTSS